MSIWYVAVAVCALLGFFLTALVLLQSPSGGLGSAFDGTGGQIFGEKSEGPRRATLVFGGLFLATAVATHLLHAPG